MTAISERAAAISAAVADEDSKMLTLTVSLVRAAAVAAATSRG